MPLLSLIPADCQISARAHSSWHRPSGNEERKYTFSVVSVGFYLWNTDIKTNYRTDGYGLELMIACQTAEEQGTTYLCQWL